MGRWTLAVLSLCSMALASPASSRALLAVGATVSSVPGGRTVDRYYCTLMRVTHAVPKAMPMKGAFPSACKDSTGSRDSSWPHAAGRSPRCRDSSAVFGPEGETHNGVCSALCSQCSTPPWEYVPCEDDEVCDIFTWTCRKVRGTSPIRTPNPCLWCYAWYPHQVDSDQVE